MSDDGVKQRLAAIMAADVAGYSRLMGDDERATVAALDDCRALFHEHVSAAGGRIVDTAGDSVLAVFDVATGAVQAAQGVQEALQARNDPLPEDRRMRFRIGIHLGEVLHKADGTIYGDGVNIAARLEGLAEPGGICVSDMVQGAVKGRVAASFSDLGEHAVKNIAEPVRAYAALAATASVGTPKRQAPRRALLAGIALAVGLAIAAWLWLTPAPQEAGETLGETIGAMPTGPLVAVLPFENRSEDPAQDFFSDGLTEDIITALTRFTGIRVAAPASVFKYKGTELDFAAIRSEIGADFVLQGSVRRAENSIRVAVKLYDTENGDTVWGENYDRDLTLESVFDIQDDVTQSVAGMVGGDFGAIAERSFQRALSRDGASLSGYECVLKRFQFMRILSEELHADAKACLLRTVEREPNYADAWSALADIYVSTVTLGFESLPDENPLELGEIAANKALALDNDHQSALSALAWIFYFQGKHDRVPSFTDRAIAANPNNSYVYDLGLIVAYGGEWQKGLAYLERGMSLNPDHPSYYHFPFAFDLYRRGEYEAAIAVIEKVQLNDHYYLPAFYATTYAAMGRLEEARDNLDRVLGMNPDFAETAHGEYKAWFPVGDLADRILEDLKRAGLDIPELRDTTN